MASTVVKNYFDAFDYKLQQLSSPSLVRCLTRALDDLCVETKADVEAIVESKNPNSLNKLTKKLWFLIVKAVKSKFEDALQASNFNSNKGLKSSMFNVMERTMG